MYSLVRSISRLRIINTARSGLDHQSRACLLIRPSRHPLLAPNRRHFTSRFANPNSTELHTKHEATERSDGGGIADRLHPGISRNNEPARNSPSWAPTSGTYAFAGARPAVSRRKSWNGPTKRPKSELNRVMRDYFDPDSDMIRETLKSPYVPIPKAYPSPAMAAESEKHARGIAIGLMGSENIAREMYGQEAPSFQKTFRVLRSITPSPEQDPMAAIRVVFPKGWDLNIKNKEIDYVDSQSGLSSKIRISRDNQDPSIVVVRARASRLPGVAEDMKKMCSDAVIYRLGGAKSRNSERTALPTPQALDSGSLVHEESAPRWIDCAYEDIPKPAVWTLESFHQYVTSLVYGRLRTELAAKLYKQSIDTDGIRVKLILEAFLDPGAKTFITPHIFRLASSFLSTRGGHRASARVLRQRAVEWGVPIDTELFNDVLEGYVVKHDAVHFDRTLMQMRSQHLNANARTWILFLRFLQRDYERKKVLIAMCDYGFHKEPGVHGELAEIFASHDAYTSFQRRDSLNAFWAEQTKRYGEGWYTGAARGPILHELLRLRPKDKRCEDAETVLNWKPSDGRAISLQDINMMLRFASANHDWEVALLALRQFSNNHHLTPNVKTYDSIFHLAINTHMPHVLSVAILHGILERRIGQSRITLRKVIDGEHADPFWKPTQLLLLSQSILHSIHDRGYRVVEAVEWAVLSALKGYKPVLPLHQSLSQALATEKRNAKLSQSSQPPNTMPWTLLLVDPNGVLPNKEVVMDSSPAAIPIRRPAGWDSSKADTLPSARNFKSTDQAKIRAKQERRKQSRQQTQEAIDSNRDRLPDSETTHRDEPQSAEAQQASLSSPGAASLDDNDRSMSLGTQSSGRQGPAQDQTQDEVATPSIEMRHRSYSQQSQRHINHDDTEAESRREWLFDPETSWLNESERSFVFSARNFRSQTPDWSSDQASAPGMDLRLGEPPHEAWRRNNYDNTHAGSRHGSPSHADDDYSARFQKRGVGW
ncbi:hypothetical protein B0I35DRAFT_405236 [Stachybotrys elegans]|uniref:Uncharacterized protein n=1 Tax=Stachybotrys elegans TaxID=80388 RepID=A0A8K0SZW7_9HYPO|nr:hypothetical protein B0I35DRAFT_405236 [Stachybotrys elegans]